MTNYFQATQQVLPSPMTQTHQHHQEHIESVRQRRRHARQPFDNRRPQMRAAHALQRQQAQLQHVESTETIDYSADVAKDLKPPHSYAQLIGVAILSTPQQQMTLDNIYKCIVANYAFYRFNTGDWQNSIRHELSVNKAFTKIARRKDEPGRGMKWMIEQTEFDNFVRQRIRGCRTVLRETTALHHL